MPSFNAMMNSRSTKKSDITRWVRAQSDQLEKAVRDQSLESCVDTGSPLFAAVFFHESETPLKNVQLLTSWLKRIDEEVNRLQDIASASRVCSLPHEKRVSVMEKASRWAKFFVVTPETKTGTGIEECTTVHEARIYLGAFKNIYYGLQSTKQSLEFKEILDWETAIWKYWMIYDACLNLAKSATLVTASNVIDKCITALYLFKEQVTSVDGYKGLTAQESILDVSEDATTPIMKEPSPSGEKVNSSVDNDGRQTCLKSCSQASAMHTGKDFKHRPIWLF